MGAHELYSLASQHVPIQSINPTGNGLDTKKQKAIVASYTLTQGIYESTEAYQQRMAQFRAELARKSKEENTEKLNKKIEDLKLFDFNTTDKAALQRHLSELQSVSRSYYSPLLQFNKGADDGIYLVRQQMALTENKLAKLKTGEEDKSTSQNPISSASRYNFEYQNPGERDFLA